MIETLHDAYNSTCDTTLAKWKLCDGIGAVKDPPFHLTRLAVTSGNYLPLPPAGLELLGELAQLAGNDPLANLADPSCLHATFLAITLPEYDSPADLPDLSALKSCFARHGGGTTYSLHDLRLIALPNALLLAGYPDSDTLARRHDFAESLLTSSWNNVLRARFPNGPIPPLFWHSTLLRYQAESLPTTFRRFFVAHQGARFGSVSSPIQLMAANYNWKIAFRLDEPAGAQAS